MTLHMKKNDPAKAHEFFKAKMSFTTGPVEVDYYRGKGGAFKVIDVRAREDYDEGHVPGAISLPEDEWSTFKGLSKDSLNIVYCYTQVCHLAAKSAVKFTEAG